MNTVLCFVPIDSINVGYLKVISSMEIFRDPRIVLRFQFLTRQVFLLSFLNYHIHVLSSVKGTCMIIVSWKENFKGVKYKYVRLPFYFIIEVSSNRQCLIDKN